MHRNHSIHVLSAAIVAASFSFIPAPILFLLAYGYRLFDVESIIVALMFFGFPLYLAKKENLTKSAWQMMRFLLWSWYFLPACYAHKVSNKKNRFLLFAQVFGALIVYQAILYLVISLPSALVMFKESIPFPIGQTIYQASGLVFVDAIIAVAIAVKSKLADAAS